MTDGPSIWAVSDGRAGIQNQVKALVAALAEPERAVRLVHIKSDAHRSEPLILQPQGPQLLLRPDIWPSPLNALPKRQRNLLVPPWPNLWIAAGRRSIPYSLAMSAETEETLVVQTQDPRVDLDPFDLVIPPMHDNLQGPNVLPILGSPTWFSRERIEDAQRTFKALAEQDGLKVLVSLGGSSKTHSFNQENADAIEQGLREAAGKDVRYWITVSRRTPEPVAARFRQLAKDLGGVFWENEERDGPNPYVAFLSMCDVALVTCDSANMISDPAFFGKPIHLLKLDGGSERFDRLYQGFIDKGAARWFLGDLNRWSYEPIREAARAADEIVKMLLQKHPRR